MQSECWKAVCSMSNGVIWHFMPTCCKKARQRLDTISFLLPCMQLNIRLPWKILVQFCRCFEHLLRRMNFAKFLSKLFMGIKKKSLLNSTQMYSIFITCAWSPLFTNRVMLFAAARLNQAFLSPVQKMSAVNSRIHRTQSGKTLTYLGTYMINGCS